MDDTRRCDRTHRKSTGLARWKHQFQRGPSLWFRILVTALMTCIVVGVIYDFADSNSSARGDSNPAAGVSNVFFPLSGDKIVADHDAYCPCCGYSGTSFVAFKTREDARCPRCAALERHRLGCNQFDTEILQPFQERVKHKLEQSLVVEESQKNEPMLIPRQRIRLLHFGPQVTMANGFNAAQSLVEQFQADFFVGYGYKGEVLRVDVQNIMFPDSTFDAILILHVVEHVKNDTLALHELSRVLKPGGRMLFEVPCLRNLKQTIDCVGEMTDDARAEKCGQWDHLRRYACSDVETLLHRSPFQCQLQRLSEGAMYVIARTAKIDQYVCVNKKK